MIMPYSTNFVYKKPPGLLLLLRYARTHRHSHQWIPAILNILARRGCDA
jgi:hypothetical protein